MKPTVHQFDPEVYPRKLWVVLNATPEILNKHFEFESPLDPKWFEDYDTITSQARSKESQHRGIVIWSSGSSIDVSDMTHEAVHFADSVFDIIGETTKTEECMPIL